MKFWGQTCSMVMLVVMMACWVNAKENDLTSLSLEELSNLEVTSVSKAPQKLQQAAAAIYVITQDDIRRSGATNIPEALRLAPGVEVERINQNQWAIGVRGNLDGVFGGRLSRQVLVLIDGRSVYDPLFSGTYWELQNYVLGDIDRIEVIRGPGGALWGTNAVNGVINIITKSAKETQGGRISTGGGTDQKEFGSVRYGGKIGQSGYYRAYGKYFDQDASFHANGNDFDPWHMGQSGFRTDWDVTSQDLVTVQGDMYRGRAGQAGTDSPFSNLFGTNLLSRWTRTYDSKSGFSLQVYYDRADRHDPIYLESANTGDIDFQYRLALPGRQDVTWGLQYRIISDETGGSSIRLFAPDDRLEQIYSGFLQDQISLIPDRLSLILGTKLENDYFSGWEFQPSIRLQGTLTRHQTLWTAVSRAVREPSRLERDLSVNGLVRGGSFDAEKVTAYEIGYRVEPASWLSTDFSVFYNDYTDMLSIESSTSPLSLSNNVKGASDGFELALDAQALSWWRLRGSYSLLDIHMETTAQSADLTTVPTTENSNPRHQVALHSMMNLPHHTELDPVWRYVSALPAQNTPAYMEMDVRVAWHPIQRLELALVGQNLLHAHHPEFGTLSEIERGVYGKVTWEWLP